MNKIKFRQINPNGGFHYWGYIEDERAFTSPIAGPSEIFTGRYDSNDDEIYTGDTIVTANPTGIDPHDGSECDKWEEFTLPGSPVHWSEKYTCLKGIPDENEWDSMYHKRFCRIKNP